MNRAAATLLLTPCLLAAWACLDADSACAQSTAEALSLSPPFAQTPGAVYGEHAPAIGYVARIRLEGAIGVEYLVGMHSGEAHLGPVLRLGIAIPVTGELDLTLHARGSVALDVVSPRDETRPPTTCGGYGLVYTCNSDNDYVMTLGADLGVRYHGLLANDAMNAMLFTLAGGLSYTYFANTYEVVPESQGAGFFARVGLSYQRGPHFRIGLEVGGRAIYDTTFGGPWLDVHGQVALGRHF